MVQLALRFVDLCLDLLILRMIGDGNVGIATELRQLNLRLLLLGLELALIGGEREAGLIVHQLRDTLALHQSCVSVEGHLVQRDLSLLGINVAQHPLVVLLHGLDR
jgi:hypothetical protein